MPNWKNPETLAPHAGYRRDPSAVLGERPAAIEGYVRLAIGIEHIDDIRADLAQALERA